jgi:hypothetical protein
MVRLGLEGSCLLRRFLFLHRSRVLSTSVSGVGLFWIGKLTFNIQSKAVLYLLIG